MVVGGSLPIPVVVVLIAALLLGLVDVWRLKVYNAFTLPLLLSGLAYHGIVGGPSAVADGLLGMLFGFGIFLPFYAAGGMGGGDVKLMAAVGAWLGLPLTFLVFLASSFAGGLYALAIVVIHGRVRETWINLQVAVLRLKALGKHLGAEDRVEVAVSQPDRRQRVVPFAAMVAVGLFGLVLWFHLLNRP